MAQLESPGVQVQVIDESLYTPAAPGTVPMIFVTSAQDKTNPSGSTAQGTTAANAGKVWLITSQRDLTDTFGTPLFPTDASGNPQHGNEINEYGLQAAYSVLGVTSRAYIVRADLDTEQLLPSSSAPTGNPAAGTWWIETDASTFGVKEWNSSTQKFTAKTPIVLDDNSTTTELSGGVPTSNVGLIGDYAMVVTGTNDENKLYKKTSSGWVYVNNIWDTDKRTAVAPHTEVPFNVSTATGSVWVVSTTPNSGANWKVKYFNGTSQSWTPVTAPLYSDGATASYNLDRSGGGVNIAVNSVYINHPEDRAEFKVLKRSVKGATSAKFVSTYAQNTTNTVTYTLTISESVENSTEFVNVDLAFNSASTTTKIASLLASAIQSSTLTNVTASWNSTNNELTITHTKGGDILINNESPAFLSNIGLTTSVDNVYDYQTGADLIISNWEPLTYEASASAPTSTPADGTLWYSSISDEVDIMYHDGTTWIGYQNQFPTTNPAGPIVSATEPTEQSDGTVLVNGDIWISTADLDRYGKDIYVYDGTEWVQQNTADQSTPDGWLFADARWAGSGDTLVAADITDLLTSDYLDPDAPDPTLYPKGMKLWNTRRSGFNVKKYISGHINILANDGNNIRYNDESMASYETDRWVSQYPTEANGSPQFGRLAQRAQTVNALKSLLDSNTAIRDTDTLTFNLLAAPGYPEVIQNLIGLNTDRGVTAFVLGDTPFRLAPTGTALSEWGNNTNQALDNGDVGATSFDEYMAMYYPSGYTNDLSGNNIVVPASHMMLRTIINSDAKSYPWFAPAGTRRGGVDNATSVGYIDSEGEFRATSLPQSLRDVLDDVKINPIATLTGIGLVAYGQRTRARNASALDRINVARLVVYLRRQLDQLARPFLFEPNDAQTRAELRAAAESLMIELVGQRALYDFIVVCDESNNTPARIDRSELYLDIAIEPVKAVEFIYIPLRLKNTGDIQAGL